MTATSAPKSIFGYEPLSPLGRGAGSLLYVVSHPKTGQIYALKHVVPQDDKFDRYLEQLRTEFEVSQSFRHPALRRSVDLRTRKRLLGPVVEAALVMELVDGASLERDVPSSLAVLLDVFAQTAAALAAMHNLLLVHCDLKPSNILRQADGRVKLIDFGQAAKLGTTKTRVQGTPDFIAPEQVRLNPVGAYTDVYNLGATLYWALTGRKAPTLFTVRRRDREMLREQQFPTPMELNPIVPRGVSEFVMDCLHVNPALRPQSMTETMRVLEHFAREAPPADSAAQRRSAVVRPAPS